MFPLKWQSGVWSVSEGGLGICSEPVGPCKALRTEAGIQMLARGVICVSVTQGLGSRFTFVSLH